jgi:hypothetical protein
MSRHSKLKKRRKGLSEYLWNPDPEAPIWLYQQGIFLDRNSTTLCEGTLEKCLKKLVKDYPVLEDEEGSIIVSCLEFGFVEGENWCIVTTAIRQLEMEETAIRIMNKQLEEENDLSRI